MLTWLTNVQACQKSIDTETAKEVYERKCQSFASTKVSALCMVAQVARSKCDPMAFACVQAVNTETSQIQNGDGLHWQDVQKIPSNKPE
mmetsp:Transcript_11993/g.21239  ORF Transcript_11993/g.21239 Transcript_11993/m.21239 type:complete len:89 (+) Transcript_11993:74-340(+)